MLRVKRCLLCVDNEFRKVPKVRVASCQWNRSRDQELELLVPTSPTSPGKGEGAGG